MQNKKNNLDKYEIDTNTLGEEFKELSASINPESFFYFKIYQILRIESSTDMTVDNLRTRYIMNVSTLEDMCRASKKLNDEYYNAIKEYKIKIDKEIENSDSEYKKKLAMENRIYNISKNKFGLLFGIITEKNDVSQPLKM